MIDTKRAFTMYCGGRSPVGRAIADGVIVIRRNQSLPAFGDCSLDECTVDLTPRRCQAFRPRPGERLTWTCTFLPPKADDRRLGGGSITADKWGLATIRQLRILKGAQRVVIQQQ